MTASNGSDLTVVSEELPGSEVGLTIEVPQETVDAAYDQVLNRLARRAKIEGFRPGKAPRALVEARVGTDALREEVIDELVPDVLAQVLEERQIEPLGRPRVDSVELERGRPAKFSAKVAVMPEVKLPDLESLRVERHATPVTEEMVQRRLEVLREAFAELQPVEREVREGDVVIGDIEMEVDGRLIESQKREAVELEVREGSLIPELRAVLPGKHTGDTAEAPVELPEEYSDADLAGKTALMRVKVQGVKEKHLPELDDELAGRLSDGKYNTVPDLEAGVRSDLEEQARRMDELAYEQAVLKDLVDRTEVEVPVALVDAEVRRQVDELETRLGRQGVRLDRYLAYQGMNEEQWREQERPEAEARLKLDLVLEEVARQRSLAPTAEQVDEYIDREAGRDEELKNQVELIKRTDSTRRYFERRLRRLRTLEALVELAGQDSATAKSG